MGKTLSTPKWHIDRYALYYNYFFLLIIHQEIEIHNTETKYSYLTKTINVI